MGCICNFLFVFVFFRVNAQRLTTFKAAVYEHAVIIPWGLRDNRSTALQNMMKNVVIYKEQATIASKQNVEIMVFPEYGISGGMLLSREGIEPYLEYIPDPEEKWNACQDPDKYKETDIQRHLSCLAKDTSMFLVVNFGDLQPCVPENDPNCPKDGHYQFNANVVYNPKGDLIAKYHKKQLYNEKQFDIPPVTKLVTFETPFGKFAVFTCFDILFQTPAIDVLTIDGVGNVVFPTAWMDALPLLAAIQFHSAFAAGAKVNLLAANINLPIDKFHGSGIYSPTGYKAFQYSESHGGKLLIADLPIVKKSAFASNFQRLGFKIKNFAVGSGQFRSNVRHDPFIFVPIENNNGTVSVCDKRLCCFLSYERIGNALEYFAFGAFDGLHNSKVQPYYMEVCTLLKCETANRSSCGGLVKASMTNFTSVKISGTFKTRYIFPEVLLADYGQLKLSSGNFWTYKDGTLESKHGFEHPVLSVSLFSRDYERDDTDEKDERDGGNFRLSVTAPNTFYNPTETATVNLICIVTAGFHTQIRWYKNSQRLKVNGRFSVGTVSGPALTITGVVMSDAGTYTCEATDGRATVRTNNIQLSPIERSVSEFDIITSILNGYNKLVRPIDPVNNVTHCLILKETIEFDHKTLRFEAMQCISWNDPRLSWPRGQPRVSLPSSVIWLPDIVMLGQEVMHYFEAKAIVMKNGDVTYCPQGVIRSTNCEEKSDSVWECNFKFLSWSYDNVLLDIHFPSVLTRPTIDMYNYYEHDDYEIVNHCQARREKSYACRVGTYSELTYTFVIRRRRRSSRNLNARPTCH